MSVRTMLLWCPDWPVTAAEIVEGVPADAPVAVLHANRVVACSESARADGVRRGLRRREAQSRCPRLIVVDHDPARDARAFEPVVAAVEQVAVGVEVIRPGACALAARGPARYFGGEEAAAERIVDQVAEACAVECQAGVADGVFAAGLAARTGRIVAPGATAAFLAGLPVEALERPELTDLLRRLGIRTLGDFAALPASGVLTRFGFDGGLAHRLAAGRDNRPLAVRSPPTDLDVSDTYDEPLDRVDVAAFAGRALAERLHDQLAAHGLACTRLGIEAVTADGQELHRVWRHEGLLTPAAIAERVRWQLDGWLTGARRGGVNRPTAGLVRLRLIPGGLLVHLGLQPGLWGDTGAGRDRAHRALSRVQGLLGPEAVVTAVTGGGRSADDPVRLIPWGDERAPARVAAAAREAYPGAESVVAAALTSDPDPVPLRSLTVVPDLPAADSVSDAVSGAGFVRSPVPARSSTPVPALDSARGSTSVPASARGSTPGRVSPASASGPALFAVPGPNPVSVPASDSVLSLVPASGPAMAVVAGSVSPRARTTTPATTDPAVTAPARVLSLVRESSTEQSAAEGSSLASDESLPAEESPGRKLPLLGEQTEPLPAEAEVAAPLSAEKPSPAGPRSEANRTTRRKPRRRAVALPPWPGRLPTPAPAVVLDQPLAAVVLDAAGEVVRVSARLEPTGLPDRLVVERARPVPITGWAGPWPIDERWWAPAEARRRARFQVGLDDGRALLLCLSGGHWAVEAIYD